MATLQNNRANSIDRAFTTTLSIAHPTGKNGSEQNETHNTSDWMGILGAKPILQMLRPDFYLVFKYNPFQVVYQENIRLDLGVNQVTYNLISRFSKAMDLEHIQKIDFVIEQFIRECRLQPFDFICKILCNVECPNESGKRLMRTTFVAQCDKSGNAEYGVMCFHDITLMTGSIRPYNYDITFAPEKSELCHEAYRRIRNIIPTVQSITRREREIIACLDRGLSSKETAAILFISKATVDTHRQNMLRKCGLPNTSALLRKAKEEGWI